MPPRSGRASSSQIADAQMSFGEWFQQAFSESPHKSSSKKVTASCSASTKPLALKNIPTKPVAVKDTWEAMLSKRSAAAHKTSRDITKLAKMKDGIKESSLSKAIIDKLKEQVAEGQQLVDAARLIRSNRKTSVGDFDKMTKKLKKWFEAAQHLGRLATFAGPVCGLI